MEQTEGGLSLAEHDLLNRQDHYAVLEKRRLPTTTLLSAPKLGARTDLLACYEKQET